MGQEVLRATSVQIHTDHAIIGDSDDTAVINTHGLICAAADNALVSAVNVTAAETVPVFGRNIIEPSIHDV